MDQGKLICFADDFFFICDNKQIASDLIKEMDFLSESGLFLNETKT